MKRFTVLLGMVVGIVLAFSNCSKTTNPVGPDTGSGTITVGSYTPLTTSTIGSSGGVVRVSSGTLSGMTITIPAGSFKSAVSFSISSADIKSHSFGSDFNPITPLIRIDNGGGYADSVMTLTIPCVVPAGHFAMGFYYDEETGELEGIPVVAINANNIVLAARHFSSAQLSDGRKGNALQGTKSWVDILVSSMQTDKLFEVQESGFRPAIDDWEFPNYGSYIAPGGHCTGQSLTAMWYYTSHKVALKEPQLNGRFETVTGSMWQDNRNGYRFASVVWADQDVNRREAWLEKFNDAGTARFSRDSLHYLAFAYSIHMTKKPQLVEIWHATGGHAMIVYRASGNVLSIADPNFPGSYSHLISLNSSGLFSPYESRQCADSPSTFYPIINYVAKSALFSFETVSGRYAEMLKGTIGDFPPKNFPSVDLLYYNGTGWVLMPDTLSTTKDTLIFAARCIACGDHYGANLTLLLLLDADGYIVANSDASGNLAVPITQSAMTIPLYIKGSRSGANWRYIDFKKVIINSKGSRIAIDPKTRTGALKTEYSWLLNLKGANQSQEYYVDWSFGDYTAKTRMTNDSTVKHTYQLAGDYKVIAALYLKSTNSFIAADTASISIKANGITVAPNSGPVGTFITITGSGFGAVQRSGDDVTLHTDDSSNHHYTALHTISWSDTKIESMIYNEPNDNATMYVKLRWYDSTQFDYTWSSPATFHVLKCGVSDVSPDTISAGTTLIVSGNGFGDKGVGDNVMFQGIPATQIVSWSNTRITCIVPPNVGRGSLQILVMKGAWTQGAGVGYQSSKYVFYAQ